MVQSFNSDGFEIAYLDEGSGTPVVLVHGFASNHSVNWVETGWVRTLVEAGYRVLALDNRGHGQSAAPHDPSVYGAPVMAADVARLMDHAGIPRAHVMGYSMGARITAFLALAAPHRVATAIFAGLGGNMVRPMAGTGPIAAALEAPSLDDVTNPTARTFRLFAEQTKSDLKALAACIRSSRDPITAEALATLQMPVLVAVGSLDVIGGPADDLARLIPRGEACVIEGRDHMKSVGDRSYKQAALEFLARHRDEIGVSR
ncbi:MAG: alpha/beta fold hydrolase [Hyphomicrobiaceae bacterium]